MQFQLNTDHHFTGSPDLAAELEADVRDALDRFVPRLTRVELHLNDLNAGKGGDDIRCQVEARLAGRAPISVECVAATTTQAVGGALDKLDRALDHVIGKLEAGRRTGGERSAGLAAGSAAGGVAGASADGAPGEVAGGAADGVPGDIADDADGERAGGAAGGAADGAIGGGRVADDGDRAGAPT
jgi:hypothetical protein